MALVATLDNTSDVQEESASAVEEGSKLQAASKEVKTDAGEKDGTTVDSLARDLGWTPKDEFKGNPEDYVDAATYIRRSKDITESKNNQIGSLKRQLKEISSVVQELKTHNERVNKTEVKRLEGELEVLKKERKVAITDGDVEKVEEIEQKISVLHTDASDTLKAVNKKDESTEVPENTDWVAWKKANSWYGTDDEITAFADKFALKYEGAPFKRVLELVREEAERVFPDKFPKNDKAENKAAINPVEPGTRKSSTKTRFTKADLTASQRAIMGKFIKQGVMSEEDYIKDLATMGELT